MTRPEYLLTHNELCGFEQAKHLDNYKEFGCLCRSSNSTWRSLENILLTFSTSYTFLRRLLAGEIQGMAGNTWEMLSYSRDKLSPERRTSCIIFLFIDAFRPLELVLNLPRRRRSSWPLLIASLSYNIRVVQNPPKDTKIFCTFSASHAPCSLVSSMVGSC